MSNLRVSKSIKSKSIDGCYMFIKKEEYSKYLEIFQSLNALGVNCALHERMSLPSSQLGVYVYVFNGSMYDIDTYIEKTINPNSNEFRGIPIPDDLKTFLKSKDRVIITDTECERISSSDGSKQTLFYIKDRSVNDAVKNREFNKSKMFESLSNCYVKPTIENFNMLVKAGFKAEDNFPLVGEYLVIYRKCFYQTDKVIELKQIKDKKLREILGVNK